MRTIPRLLPLLLAAACGATGATAVRPTPLILPDSVVVLDARSGATLGAADLVRRADAADLVLLGELHDNAWHHRVRGALIAASSRRPAVVFEQFAVSSAAFPPPAAGEPVEAWLDAWGFDRKGWRWPLHQPVVAAAIAHGRTLWGSNMSREALRAVVRGGAAGAPADLRRIMEQSPMDSVARAALDKELVDGHCGQLPAEMIPGMRAAQEVRDAAMTQALIWASATGPAWLIAGNGHVRADMAVPRILPKAAPGKQVLVVGLLERQAGGGLPDQAARAMYDVVIVTPPATRTDPCAGVPRR